MPYTEDDMLMLSGIQHIVFCPRQWALIHIEQQWDENKLTAEGMLIHKNVDNPSYRQLNNGVATLHSVHVASATLGIYGICDAVELHPAKEGDAGISHPKYKGRWTPYPVEYKHGSPKTNDCDRLQLAAQVMCLEEMYGITIPEAALFYFKTRRREIVKIDDELKKSVVHYVRQMHDLFDKGAVPPPVKKPCCNKCSLVNICLPEISKLSSVSSYIKNMFDEETS